MGFNCELTESTKALFRQIILASTLKDISSANMLVVWIFEYFCAYLYINTNALVDFKNIDKHEKVSKAERSIVNILQNIRNNVTHSPFKLEILFKQFAALLNILNKSSYGNFFEVFEYDKYEILSLLKKCAKFCMLYYEEKIESIKAEHERTVSAITDSELPDIDNLY